MDRLRSTLSGRAGVMLTVILSMALGMSLAAAFMGRDAAYAVDDKTAAKQQRAALYDLESAFTSLADEVLPSVVSITGEVTVDTPQIPWFDEEFFKEFPFPFGRPDTNTPAPRKTPVYGSGVIVRSDGYILTNDHVVGGAEEVKVILKDGKEFKGTVLRDPRSDLALVKIDAKNLPAAKLADSSKVKVGQWAIAIGSPFGYDQTVTVGVVSGLARQAEAPGGAGFYPNLIQTDASINPGNSGGPLVNIDGEVIGINTLIRSTSGGNIGIGFAIPSNTAKFVMEQLIAHGKVVRGYLGIRPANLTAKTAERYGVKEGAFVQSVEVGSPADKAGLQVEDVIVEIDGKPIRNEIELRDTMAATPPGKQVNVVVVRDKARKTLKVTVGEAPDNVAQSEPQRQDGTSKLGLTVENITPALAERYNLGEGMQGVVVTKVNPAGPAAQAGVQAGMVVTRVNDSRVRSVAEFNAATKSLKKGDTVRLVLQTKERRVLVEFEVE